MDSEKKSSTVVQETEKSTSRPNDLEKQPPIKEPVEAEESETTQDDSILPRDATEDEIASLPTVTDKIPFAAWAVIVAGAGERFTYFGLIAPWQNYMQYPQGKEPVPGALGLGQATAVNISNAFFLFSFLTPMLFALISDIWLGRYKTLLLGLVCYLGGCVVLIATSAPSALEQGAGVGGLAAALILTGLGAGSVKATYVPFLGDQYMQTKPQLVRQKNGNLVIVDGPRTLQFIYNAYYWFTNIASLSSIPVTFIEWHHEFWSAYLLATVTLCLSIALFLLWSKNLVKVKPQGNILPKAVRVLVCASKNGFKLERTKPSYQKTHHGKEVPWTNSFVEEMCRGMVACRVIFFLVIFYLCIAQMYNNLVSQAGQMLLSGVPNDMIQAFSGVACIIFGPIMQGLYEFLARRKIAFGPIARITTSFIFCGASMAYAAGVQKLIYSTGPCYNHPFNCPESEGGRQPNNVSVWVQLPVYILLAIAEILGFVTAFEYAYSKAPREMKTVVQALTQLTAGVASLLGMAISPVSRDPNMVIVYSCLAGAMGVSAVVFLWRFRRYDRIDTQLNQF
ncbi:putative peptide transporter [Triangularia setosa]|uniref:Peptide transporter n=1 Tax=Triangularia setosa TaxID=2587417 RepID=A0AAN7A636_9PEZI|nr:putative peptide transporter [Podospora setosa]